MSEEEFKEAMTNVLRMQNNNDANFQILQHQIDQLQQQISDLVELKDAFRLPNGNKIN